MVIVQQSRDEVKGAGLHQDWTWAFVMRTSLQAHIGSQGRLRFCPISRHLAQILHFTAALHREPHCVLSLSHSH